MQWKKHTIQTTTQAEDLVCGMLAALGVDGVQVEDRQQITQEEKQRMFIDILPELPADDGIAYVSFYTEDDDTPEAAADAKALLARVRAGLSEMRAYADVGTAQITEDETKDEDWINNWKEFFHPFAVDDVLIAPSWHALDEEEKEKYPYLIRIDPGTSFGTGMHETTQLVLRALRKYAANGERVLDIGCGSGILSILALKAGASQAVCMDIDPAAVSATAENMQANGIGTDRYRVFCGNLLAAEQEADDAAQQAGGGYDVVVANILADVIIPLAAKVGAHLKPGGIFVASGILDTKEAAVKAALIENGFEIVETNAQNDWVSVTARYGKQGEA